MKASDKAALAIGAVGTWIYIGGVDSDLWGRAALGAGMFLLALAAKKSEITSICAARSRKSGKKSAGMRCLRRGSGTDH